MQQTTAPAGLVDQLWSVIAPALTLPMISAAAFTIFAVHAAKIFAPRRFKHSEGVWRQYRMGALIILGALSGAGAWVGTDTGWAAVPMAPVLAFIAFKAVQICLPRRWGDELLTDTDLKFLRAKRRRE